MKTKRPASKDCILGGSGGAPNLSWPRVYVLQHYRSGSLSKGISAENRRRQDHRGRNEDLNIEARI